MSANGIVLPRISSSGRSGLTASCCEGADLALAHHRQSGEQLADEAQQQADDRRHVVEAAGEIGVVPGARAHLERRRPAGERAGEGDILDDALGVTLGDRRLVRVGAVEEQLDGRGAVREVPGVARRDRQGEGSPAVVEGGGEVAVVPGRRDDVEVAAGGERGDELAAFTALIAVEDDRRVCRTSVETA